MAKIRVSYEYSEAEDKSIRLGLFLIACGILSLFILGFCWLSPTLQSLQSKPANCTVVSVLRPEEMFECVFTCGADCKGTSLYPCLQIFVNNSESNSVALLHFDEQQLVLNPKCSYVPPCERDNQKNKDSVLWWEDYFTREVSSQSFTCFFNQQRRPKNYRLFTTCSNSWYRTSPHGSRRFLSHFYSEAHLLLLKLLTNVSAALKSGLQN
uniref:Potassium calcium-activated channel subfamily M regulatory beta subunit 4 n=1 Tax=Amphiprion ocellaris TaxID=80972 RepID=A0A3Q1BKN6_AMPOC